MKKIILLLLSIILMYSQIIGYTQEEKKNLKENQEINTIDRKEEDDIRKIGYESLNKKSKETIIDWKNAKVDECKYKSDHIIGSTNGSVNIRGKAVYRVNFKTTDEALLGPIIVYIDKNSYNVLGNDFRD